jgi:hypothetical protein
VWVIQIKFRLLTVVFNLLFCLEGIFGGLGSLNVRWESVRWRGIAQCLMDSTSACVLSWKHRMVGEHLDEGFYLPLGWLY